MGRRTHTQAATTSALAWSIFDTNDFDALLITLSFGTAISTAEDLTVTLDSHLGAGSDETLLTIPGADLVGKTSVVIKSVVGLVNGDKILISFTNTDGVSITGTATTRLTNRATDEQPVREEPLQYFINGIEQGSAKVLGGSDMFLARKTITFSNNTGNSDIFAVTGDVEVKVLAVVKTNVASAGGCNVELGITGATGALIATTDATLLAAGEIWHDATPDAKIEAASVAANSFITTGEDIILTYSAQADSGAIAFYCWWRPLSADGAVVAA